MNAVHMIPIHVVFVEPASTARDVLVDRLNADDRLMVSRTLDGPADLESVLAETPCHVLLADIFPARPDYFAMLGRLHRQDAPLQTVLRTDRVGLYYVEMALNAGVRGYLSKEAPPGEVIEAIVGVSEGQYCFGELVQGHVRMTAEGPQPVARSKLTLLTGREIEVLDYLARGATKKQISQLLGIGVPLVSDYFHKIGQKLDVSDRMALMRFALREGLGAEQSSAI